MWWVSRGSPCGGCRVAWLVVSTVVTQREADFASAGVLLRNCPMVDAAGPVSRLGLIRSLTASSRWRVPSQSCPRDAEPTPTLDSEG